MQLSFIFDQTGRPPEAGKLFRPAAGLKPNPDKPGRIATKAPRHKEKKIIIKTLCALVAKLF